MARHSKPTWEWSTIEREILLERESGINVARIYNANEGERLLIVNAPLMADLLEDAVQDYEEGYEGSNASTPAGWWQKADKLLRELNV